jgi:hypothetical protein
VHRFFYALFDTELNTDEALYQLCFNPDYIYKCLSRLYSTNPERALSKFHVFRRERQGTPFMVGWDINRYLGLDHYHQLMPNSKIGTIFNMVVPVSTVKKYLQPLDLKIQMHEPLQPKHYQYLTLLIRKLETEQKNGTTHASHTKLILDSLRSLEELKNNSVEVEKNETVEIKKTVSLESEMQQWINDFELYHEIQGTTATMNSDTIVSFIFEHRTEDDTFTKTKCKEYLTSNLIPKFKPIT